MFAEDLSANTNNELDFTTLDLADDEYVTDFEFRFGTVKVDYQEVETPVVYCKVLNGLENGYTFTNTTKVSGSYLEKYVEDNDEWTSVVYKKILIWQRFYLVQVCRYNITSFKEK